MMRAKFFGERFLIFSATERDGFKAHTPRVLHAEMAKPTDALHRDDVARARARIAQRVEHRNARAHERTGLFRRQFIRNRRHRFGGRNHVFGVTAVEIDAGDFAIDAHREIAAPPLRADETMPAMPAYTNALAFFPVRHAITDCVDAAGNFMTRPSSLLK